ncbi:uncharacterized protein LOC134240337 [Saccostrea cucullata]|uniref:uncharacterized protein LOC134240337 n=1 Tax=Saccostrea cuccullata TaxID=36930 RepID=UPI002ED0A5A5
MVTQRPRVLEEVENILHHVVLRNRIRQELSTKQQALEAWCQNPLGTVHQTTGSGGVVSESTRNCPPNSRLWRRGVRIHQELSTKQQALEAWCQNPPGTVHQTTGSGGVVSESTRNCPPNSRLWRRGVRIRQELSTKQQALEAWCQNPPGTVHQTAGSGGVVSESTRNCPPNSRLWRRGVRIHQELSTKQQALEAWCQNPPGTVHQTAGSGGVVSESTRNCPPNNRLWRCGVRIHQELSTKQQALEAWCQNPPGTVHQTAGSGGVVSGDRGSADRVS